MFRLKRLSFLSEFKWMNSNKYTSVCVCEQEVEVYSQRGGGLFHILSYSAQERKKGRQRTEGSSR